MAASYNPYEAPNAGGYGSPRNVSAGEMITPIMVDHLRAARPWIRFLSILLFIGAAFTALAAMLMFLSGLIGLAPKRGMGAEAIVGPIGGLIYMVVAAFYGVPGIFMHRLANAIDNFVMIQSSSALEDTLDKNLGYWKVTGIMALVMMVFGVLMFFGAIAAGIAAGIAAKP